MAEEPVKALPKIRAKAWGRLVMLPTITTTLVSSQRMAITGTREPQTLPTDFRPPMQERNTNRTITPATMYGFQP